MRNDDGDDDDDDDDDDVDDGLGWMIRLGARMGRTASEKNRPRRANAADPNRLADP